MKKKLLLHACCGPCATTAIERLLDYSPVLFWYNPSIEPEEEHNNRFNALQTLATATGTEIVFFDYDYETENKHWHNFVKGMENEPEGGRRCQKCFEFRLNKLREFSKSKSYDIATTSLTVSPYKNMAAINEIGTKLFDQDNRTKFLAIDLKEDEGYKLSIELSKKYNLYRQKYCGCFYSLKPKAES